jgi:hypothetical protein
MRTSLTLQCHLFLFSVKRPYRIPLPDWAAVLVAAVPVLGIFAVFLVSDLYVCAINLCSITFGYVFIKFGQSAKERGWFSYREKEAADAGDEYIKELDDDGVV